MLEEALRRAQARRDGSESPIPLPWNDMLEQFGGGLWPGVHVLVGGTGTGKTAWALQVALHAVKNGHPVGYVGLELEDMQIALRLLAEEARVPWSALYLGRQDPPDAITKAHAVKAQLASLPFYVEMGRPGGWPISELGAFIERMRAAHPEPRGAGSLPMLLILDFLQIVGDETTADGRAMGLDLRERIGRAAYFARDAARRHNVAVVLISSTARANYSVLASGSKDDAGLGVATTMEGTRRGEWTHVKPGEGGVAKDSEGRPIVRRTVANPDVLVGLGKESGEIEYSADSVTVAVRSAEKIDGSSSFLFITAKGRATGPAWTELRFNGHRFAEAQDRGLELFGRMMATKTESTSKGRASDAGDAKRAADKPIPGI
jgi:replicative DNA helicase